MPEYFEICEMIKNKPINYDPKKSIDWADIDDIKE